MKYFTPVISPRRPASFWDALVSLAGSQHIADAIAERSRSRRPHAHANSSLPEDDGEGATGSPLRRRRPDPLYARQQQHARQPRFEIPPMRKEDCAKIAMARDSPSRVQAVTESLLRLRATDLAPFVEALRTATIQNDKEQTLRGLGSWLKLCVDSGLLPQEAAVLTLRDLAENWDLIVHWGGHVAASEGGAPDVRRP